jgi:hypothetical protein
VPYRTCLVGLTVVLAACRDAPAASHASLPQRVDLGLIEDARAVQHASLRVANTTSTRWVVEDVSPSCSCVVVQSRSTRVEPGGELEVAFTFDPRGLRGPVHQTLAVRLADGAAFPLATIVGSVVPAPYAEPSAIVAPTTEAEELVVNLVLPGSDGEAEVVASPPDIEVTPRAHTELGSARLFSFRVSRRAEASGDAASDEVSFALRYSGGRPAASLVLPVLRDRPAERALRHELVLVGREAVVGDELVVGWSTPPPAAALAAAEVTLEPENVWTARLSVEGLRLTRGSAVIDAAVTCRLSGLGTAAEELLILPMPAREP